MFVPVYDNNALTNIRFQFVTIGLILINVIVFVLTATKIDAQTATSFALVPTELFSEGIGPNIPGERFDTIPVPERYTLLSYMFIHGDIFHIGGNMLFLWVFGDNVEDAMGHMRFLIFYLLCGVIAGLAHSWMLPQSGQPLIGASGAVAGVIAAYLILHPKVTVWVLLLRVIPIKISALIALGLWIAMNFAMVFVPGVSPVAWWAHVGGIVAGAVLVVFMKRAEVPLFDGFLRRT